MCRSEPGVGIGFHRPVIVMSSPLSQSGRRFWSEPQVDLRGSRTDHQKCGVYSTVVHAYQMVYCVDRLEDNRTPNSASFSEMVARGTGTRFGLWPLIAGSRTRRLAGTPQAVCPDRCCPNTHIHELLARGPRRLSPPLSDFDASWNSHVSRVPTTPSEWDKGKQLGKGGSGASCLRFNRLKQHLMDGGWFRKPEKIRDALVT
jgi:hypothetical protein